MEEKLTLHPNRGGAPLLIVETPEKSVLIDARRGRHVRRRCVFFVFDVLLVSFVEELSR